MTPARGLVLLRPVETPEQVGGGRIILTENTREVLTTHQMEVVSVGAPSICEDEDCERPHCTVTERGWDYLRTYYSHDCDIDEGDWVLVRHRSLTETHQDNLYVVGQDDILARIEA